MLITKKKNWVNVEVRKSLNLEKHLNSFMIKKLKDIFLKWNIIFFKLVNLRKNKIKISKINLYKNTFIFFFTNLKKLNIFLDVLKKKINVLNINFNGYILNYDLLEKWNFSNILFEKIYINLYLKLICGLVIKVLLNLLLKSLIFIKYNFINKKCLNI